MSDTNIFDSAAPQTGEFKKWEKIGDQVQGTYIDVREGTDGYGNAQIIYVLKDTKENKIWNVAFKKSNQIILDRMATVHLGQIVGFRYEEDRPSKRVEGRNAKIIRVYSDPKIVDQQWIAERRQIEAQFGGSIPPVPTPTPVVATPAQPAAAQATSVPDSATPVMPAVPVTEAKDDSGQLEAIRNLARTQGLTNDAMDVAAQDAAIAAYTNLELVEDNFTQVIIKLTGYNK